MLRQNNSFLKYYTALVKGVLNFLSLSSMKTCLKSFSD